VLVRAYGCRYRGVDRRRRNIYIYIYIMEGVFCETKRGLRAEILSYGKRCRRKKPEQEFHGAICAIHTPLKPIDNGERFFEIKIDEVSVFDWSGGLDVGVTSIHPQAFPETIPTLIDDLPKPLWWIDGAQLLRVYTSEGEYKEIPCANPPAFNTGQLKVGDLIKVSITAVGGIRVEVNGEICVKFENANIATDRELFGLVSVYGRTTCVSLTGGSFDERGTTMVQVRREVVELWERVLEKSPNDIELLCKDGIVEAHLVVLSAISDAFFAMLSHPMSEKNTKVINMREYTCTEIRFFLRLIYTGQVDPEEWDIGQDEDEMKVAEKLEELANGGAHSPSSSRRSVDSRDMCSTSTPVPRDRHLHAHRHPHHPPHHPHHTTLSVEDPPPPMKADIDPDGPIREEVETIETDSTSRGEMPMSLLLPAMSLCRKYEICYEEWLYDKIKQGCSCHTFAKIAEFAIREDITALRLWLLKFAVESPSIRILFEAEFLPPRVLYELRAAFPSVRKSRKRQSPS